jgi:hypothetical protein
MLNPNSSPSSADNSWPKASVFPTSNLQVSFHQKLIRRFFASYISSREAYWNRLSFFICFIEESEVLIPYLVGPFLTQSIFHQIFSNPPIPVVSWGPENLPLNAIGILHMDARTSVVFEDTIVCIQRTHYLLKRFLKDWCVYNWHIS